MPSKEREKELQTAGKGGNETLEIVDPVKHRKTATDAIGSHASENRDTW
jgi:hypothetical protein